MNEETKIIIDDLTKRIIEIEEFIRQKKEQQITLPLDPASRDIINNL